MDTEMRKKTPNFNSHARVGRDGTRAAAPGRRVHFNSHARVGRDAISEQRQ